MVKPDVVLAGELPLELQELAAHWRDGGRVVQARKDDAGEWRVSWVEMNIQEGGEVWVGWKRVVWPTGAQRGRVWRI